MKSRNSMEVQTYWKWLIWDLNSFLALEVFLMNQAQQVPEDAVVQTTIMLW